MDRLTGVALILLVAVLLLVAFKPVVVQKSPGSTGGNFNIQQLFTYNTTTAKVHVGLYEGVGPNQGKEINGVIKIYKSEIDDPYKVPVDAIMLAEQTVPATGADITITVNKTFQTTKGNDGKDYYEIWFLGESNDHYPAVDKLLVPVVYKDTVYETSEAITLDHVATLSWDADDAFRGTDSPVLRYSAADEAYKTDFVIKPTVDFETGRASGIFVLKQIDLEAGDENEMAKIDTLEVQVGDVDFGMLSPKDLPEHKKLDNYVKITRDQPLEVKATVTTTDGTASLTSGKVIFQVKLTDVLNNTYEQPVKAA